MRLTAFFFNWRDCELLGKEPRTWSGQEWVLTSAGQQCSVGGGNGSVIRAEASSGPGSVITTHEACSQSFQKVMFQFLNLENKKALLSLPKSSSIP